MASLVRVISGGQTGTAIFDQVEDFLIDLFINLMHKKGDSYE